MDCCGRQGIVEVVSDVKDKPDLSTTQYLTTGQVVGRLALFDLVPEPRTESATAMTKCLLLQIRRVDICRMFSDDRDMLSDYQLSVLGHGSRLWHVLCNAEARLNFVISMSGGDTMAAIAELEEAVWRLSVEMMLEGSGGGNRGSVNLTTPATEKAKRGGALSFFKKKYVQSSASKSVSPAVRRQVAVNLGTEVG